MKSGYWGNYETGRIFLIDEHELYIRRPEKARELGIPEELIVRFSEFRLRQDRYEFIKFLLRAAPVMRIRGHGEYVTFEFDFREWAPPLKLIHAWCWENAGPFSGLNIVNLHSMEIRRCLWKDFT